MKATLNISNMTLNNSNIIINTCSKELEDIVKDLGFKSCNADSNNNVSSLPSCTILTTSQYIDTISAIARPRKVDWNTFKELHKNEDGIHGKLTIDGIIANYFKSVVWDKEGVRVYFANGTSARFNFDGTFIRYYVKKNGRECSHGLNGYGKGKGTFKDGGHIRVSILNRDFYLERIIKILDDIKNNLLPESYSGFVANMIRTDGNTKLADMSKIKPDFSPCNIEWTTDKENLKAYNIVKYLEKRTGKHYVITANDKQLQDLYTFRRDSQDFIDYCDQNYKTIQA